MNLLKLHYTRQQNADAEIVKMLLEAGADPPQGRTAIEREAMARFRASESSMKRTLQ